MSDTAGIDAMILRLEEAKNALPQILFKAGEAAGEAVRRAISDAAPQGQSGGTPPGNDGAGRLRDSFGAQTVAQGDGAMTAVKTTQPTKLSYVVDGTGLYGPLRHLITPVQAKALYWEGADHPYRSVKGQQPNDFVSPVISVASETIQPVVSAAFQEFGALLGESS